MNTGEHTEETASAPLPVLTDERIDAIEKALFADIGRERAVKRTHRGRWWIGGAAAAAVIVVAAIIAPSVGGLLGTGGSGGSADTAGPSAVAPDQGQPAPNTSGGSDSSAVTGGGKTESSQGALGTADVATPDRDIIRTASATVVVADIPAAAKKIADAAEARGGYVESMTIGQTGGGSSVDSGTGIVKDSTVPYPYPQDGGWITVRVPAADLSAMVQQLSALGEVTSSAINRQDVTDQTLDLKARIDASQTSVDRLTALMAQATSVADLIAAESALADRQATLESYQAQLASLDSMVDMSSLTVTLQPVTTPVKADPAGFTDGLVAGWNGLVATLNGIVLALGFMIPWLVVLAIAGLIVWFVVRLVRRRRAVPAKASPSSPTAQDDPGSAP